MKPYVQDDLNWDTVLDLLISNPLLGQGLLNQSNLHNSKSSTNAFASQKSNHANYDENEQQLS